MPGDPRTRSSGPVAVIGLGFGDEGKGAAVDALSRRRRARLVVRYNGGPQAAHHVVTPEGRVHCFAQFGAGALAGARTFLSRFMLVEPLALAREADALAAAGLSDPFGTLVIDRRCPLVTPFHRLLGRIEELSRGTARHGSCGLGVGPAWRDAHNPHAPCLRFGDLTGPPASLRRALRQIQLLKLDRAEQLLDLAPEAAAAIAPLLAELARRDFPDDIADAYRAIAPQIATDEGETFHAALRDHPDRVLLEGAHGALLDADRGFYPFVTPSAVTFAQADALLAESTVSAPLIRLGVLRAYSTRHGPGPFIAEEPALDLPEAHNRPGPWQGPMRVGWFDLVAARHGIAIAGTVDGLVLTHLDRLAGLPALRVCETWHIPGEPAPLREIAPFASESLDARAAFTRRLVSARPGWREFPDPGAADPTKIAEYVKWIAAEIVVPLAATASGPRATDQRGWSSFEEQFISGK